MSFGCRDIRAIEIAIDPSRERFRIEAELGSIRSRPGTRPAQQLFNGAIAIRLGAVHESLPII